MIYILVMPYFVLLTSTLYFVVINQLELIEKEVFISTFALITETFIVYVFFVFLYTVFRRKRLSIILTSVFYVGFLIVSLTKAKLLGSPFFPNDLLLAGDLIRTWDVFIQFVPYFVLFIAIIALICYVEIIRSNPDNVNRWLIFILFFMPLIYVCSFQQEETRLWLKNHNVFYKKNVNLVKKGIQNGFLLSYVQAALFVGKPKVPKSYSKETIESIVERYELNKPTSGDIEVDNVIILMTESFTNPDEFGWELSEKILPVFNDIIKSHISGHAISPVFGGKSINAEFELLTGMTNRFTPVETTPFQEFIKNNIPSIARSFKENGFETNAIQMVKFEGFGYGKIYDYIDVDNKVYLSSEQDGVLPDPTNRSVSSLSIATKILTLIEEQNKSFIFVFPNSSHSPWKTENYPESKLNIENSNLSLREKNQILGYSNALNHVDMLFKKLVNQLEPHNEKSLIVIVGDHQPGMKFYGDNYQYSDEHTDFINHILKKYKTSFALWSNYFNSPKTVLLSMNLIPGYIINLTNIQVSGFMKFNAILQERFDVISHIFKTKKENFTETIPSNEKQVIQDYKILQYDILFGKNYISDY